MGSHRVGHDWSNLTATAAVLILLMFLMTKSSNTEKYKERKKHTLKCHTPNQSSTLDEHYFRHYPGGSAAAAAKSLQSCPTLCNPIDSSPPGSTVPGILQAKTLEWVAISFSNAWKWKVEVKWLSCVWLFVIPWTAACQAPLSVGFSRQEYWSGLPFPSPITVYKYWSLFNYSFWFA